MASATRKARLTAARDALEAVVEEQAAAWAAAGCPPDWSVDGESNTWSNWLATKLDAIKALNELIQRASPYYVRSRHRG